MTPAAPGAAATATQVTVFLALSPITAVWLGALQTVTATSALRLALVALGLWFAHRDARE